MGITRRIEIEEVFSKPGCKWTPEERKSVQEWLYEAERYKYLLLFALRHLGDLATKEDAEDVWGDFCMDSLPSVIGNYNPARGSFWNYLLTSLRNRCHREEKKIRPRIPLETAKTAPVGVEGPGSTKLRIVSPDEALVGRESLGQLEKALNELPPHYRSVLVMYCFEEKPFAEIASAHNISINNAKVRLYRARQNLAKILRDMDF